MTINLNLIRSNNTKTLSAISFLLAASLFASIKLANLVIILLGVIWLFNIKKIKINGLQPIYILLISTTGYYLWETLSLFYSDDLREVWFRMERHSALIAIPLLFTVFTTIDLRRLLKWFSLGLIAGSVISGSKFLVEYYYQYKTGTLDLSVDMPFSEILTLHPTYMSLFLATSILFAVRLISDKVYIHVLLALYVTFASILIILLSSKLSLVFLVVSVLYFFYHLFHKQELRVRLMLLIVVVAFLVGLTIENKVLINRFKSILTRSFDRDPIKGFNTFSGRIMFWSCSISVIKNNPVLGAGIGDAQHLLDSCYIKYEPTTNSPDFLGSFNSHNQFLQAGIETGLIGIAILLVLIYWSIRNSIGAKQKELLLSILFLIVFFMFESVLLRNKGLLYFTLLISLSALANSECLIKESYRRN